MEVDGNISQSVPLGPTALTRALLCICLLIDSPAQGTNPPDLCSGVRAWPWISDVGNPAPRLSSSPAPGSWPHPAPRSQGRVFRGRSRTVIGAVRVTASPRSSTGRAAGSRVTEKSSSESFGPIADPSRAGVAAYHLVGRIPPPPPRSRRLAEHGRAAAEPPVVHLTLA